MKKIRTPERWFVIAPDGSLKWVHLGTKQQAAKHLEPHGKWWNCKLSETYPVGPEMVSTTPKAARPA